MTLVRCIPHSTEEGPIAALRNTLSMLPGAPALTERDGKFYVPSGFPAYACQQQGYVQQIDETDTIDE